MRAQVHAEETVKDLGRVSVDVSAAVRQVLGQLAALAYGHARVTSSFEDRTGNLRSSIQRGQKSTWAHFVKAGGSKARYALFVESGTRPHAIVARRAKMLRFEQGGRVVFRKRVFHPGTKPARFMQSARNVAAVMATQYVEIGLNSAIKR